MKFKEGDLIFLKSNATGLAGCVSFTVGKVYKVGGKYQRFYEKENRLFRVGVVSDDNGSENGWSVGFFELATNLNILLWN